MVRQLGGMAHVARCPCLGRPRQGGARDRRENRHAPARRRGEQQRRHDLRIMRGLVRSAQGVAVAVVAASGSVCDDLRALGGCAKDGGLGSTVHGSTLHGARDVGLVVPIAVGLEGKLLVRIGRMEEERPRHGAAHQTELRHRPMARDPWGQQHHRFVAMGRRRPHGTARCVVHRVHRAAAARPRLGGSCPLRISSWAREATASSIGRGVLPARHEVGIERCLPFAAQRAAYMRQQAAGVVGQRRQEAAALRCAARWVRFRWAPRLQIEGGSGTRWELLGEGHCRAQRRPEGIGAPVGCAQPKAARPRRCRVAATCTCRAAYRQRVGAYCRRPLRAASSEAGQQVRTAPLSGGCERSECRATCSARCRRRRLPNGHVHALRPCGGFDFEAGAAVDSPRPRRRRHVLELRPHHAAVACGARVHDAAVDVPAHDEAGDE